MNTISLPSTDGIPSTESNIPHLVPYLLPTNSQSRGAVLVCPGGGYGHRAPHEGEPIAAAFNAHGFHAFVLQYRIAPCRHPAPLSDAVHALQTLRQKAAEWGISTNHIAVCGFSAGGHLAGSLGVLHPLIPSSTPDDPSGRPDAMILCYAVLSTEAPHKGSFDNLLGPEADDELRERFSIDRHVTAETPPTFLWHTADDPAVPVENALLMAMALRAHKVPFELHVYPHGPHGVGLATGSERPCSARVAAWMPLACGWLDELGWPRPTR